MVGVQATYLLGRHVPDRAHDDSRLGVVFPCRNARFGYAGRDLSQFRETEVENLDHPRVGDQQIRRLQIPMHDAFVVCRGQSACNLNRQLDRLADRQRAVLQPFLKRDAGEQFGNDIRRAARGCRCRRRQECWGD